MSFSIMGGVGMNPCARAGSRNAAGTGKYITNKSLQARESTSPIYHSREDIHGFSADRKALHRESLMDKMKHRVVQSAISFSDTRAEILKEIREEKGQYGYSDVVNACGLSYAKLYSEIEQRHEYGQEQYYKADGTLLTKEEEIEWLDLQFEQEVAWQKSCARIAAQGQAFQGHVPQMSAKEFEEWEDNFYQAKDAYMKLYRESRREETLLNQPDLKAMQQLFDYGVKNGRVILLTKEILRLPGRGAAQGSFDTRA